MKAIGITCGVGSMLLGARSAGFKVVGNIEWCKYYHARDPNGANTFASNFPGAFFHKKVDELSPQELAAATDADLAMSHPECGTFSLMGVGQQKLSATADIPLALSLIQKLRPKFFAVDELPRSLIGFPMEEWAKLDEYNIYFEMVSNFHYGNIQRWRNRLFVLGARKDQEDFVFVPGERWHEGTIRTTIGDIEPGTPNQDKHYCGDKHGYSRALHYAFHGDRPSWREAAAIMLSRPPGWTMAYVKSDGGKGVRPGYIRADWDGWANTLTGCNALVHPATGLPLSIRERARIQGAPDDFVFYGTKYEPDGTWNLERNLHMQKQTGKFMPVHFCAYFARQVAAYLRGKDFKASQKRYLKSNLFVDAAKVDYCKKAGYGSLQKEACRQCWLTDRCPIAKSRNPNWQAFEERPRPRASS